MALKMRVLYAMNIMSTGNTTICPSTFVAAKTYLVKRVAVINRGSNPATISLNVNIQGSGTAYLVSPYNVVLQPNGQLIIDDEITLAPFDSSPTANYDKLVLNISGTTPNLDCVVTGLDRDL